MSQLILLRHGQSMWNLANLFTGWIDIPLSLNGIEEAIAAGKIIKDIPIDIIFTSELIRAQMTAMLAMAEHASKKAPMIVHSDARSQHWGDSSMTIPVVKAWELNERMYGKLQGLNKQETRDKFGDEQVHIWRRSYDVAPPEGESLEMTAARSIPYFENEIVPHLEAGRNVFVAAHGNSLRSIIMYLDKMTHAEVLNLEVATGVPMIYSYNNGCYDLLE